MFSADIANAFGGIPHSIFLSALRNSGAGEHCVDIIKDIYTDNMTTYITTDGPSQPVYANRGGKQGCPLSGLLFDS